MMELLESFKSFLLRSPKIKHLTVAYIGFAENDDDVVVIDEELALAAMNAQIEQLNIASTFLLEYWKASRRTPT